MKKQTDHTSIHSKIWNGVERQIWTQEKIPKLHYGSVFI
jgi:hypothetical protein